MNAPLVEFLLRFRERERENAAQGSRPDPIPQRARGISTRHAPAQAPISSSSSQPLSR
jgi:hypothetical protein